jgi:hypothetical protein
MAGGAGVLPVKSLEGVSPGGRAGRSRRGRRLLSLLQLGGVKEEHGDGVETQLRQRVRKRSNVGAK